MTDLNKGYATTLNGQMHNAELGESPPLVLIGETPRSSRFIEPILPLLAPCVRAIAFDLPGLGNSHPLPEPASVEAMAACVADALDAMGIAKVHLFGMHNDNQVAAALAADRPDFVNRLIPDATWWPEPLLTDVAEEEAITSRSRVDRFPARRADSMMIYEVGKQSREEKSNVFHGDAAEAGEHPREA